MGSAAALPCLNGHAAIAVLDQDPSTHTSPPWILVDPAMGLALPALGEDGAGALAAASVANVRAESAAARADAQHGHATYLRVWRRSSSGGGALCDAMKKPAEAGCGDSYRWGCVPAAMPQGRRDEG